MPLCSATVSDGGFRENPCSRNGKYTEGGKLYCYQHRPSVIAAKRAERTAKWTSEMDERRIIHQQARAFPIAMAVLRKLAKDHKDARTLTGAVALEYQELTAAALAEIEKEMGL